MPDASASQADSLTKAPPISLPKGGGAIRGMGEKFAANPVTGTGSMSVPLFASTGRGGFGPQLTLSYNSGSGTGIFGLGWELSLPEITRKTDKGLPKYFGALPRYDDVDDSDVFVLSGAEDLVPTLDDQGRRVIDTTTAPGYSIHHYRPRIEGLFARIERWTNTGDSQDCFWRSISKNNITSWYGKDANSRIADPGDPGHVFSWLLCSSYDDKGNVIVYEYLAENSDNIDLTSASERNRTPAGRSTNRYIKRIRYGNNTSRLVEPDLTQLEWHFQVIFDYGENHYSDYSAPGADPFYIQAWSDPPQPTAWPRRADPFSTYRAGFEVRGYRLCQRVLMFHAFSELGDTPCLIGATEFTYNNNPIATYMQSVTHAGFVRQRDANQAWLDRYLRKSLPPVEFTYSQGPQPLAMAQLPIAAIDSDSLADLPVGLSGHEYEWVDLDSESIAGVLSERAGAWYYKDNLGEGEFGPSRLVAKIPAQAGAAHQLLDLDGNGQLDVVLLESPTPGFFARTQNANWEPFRAFRHLPNINWNDPNLKFLDLTGDGRPDVVISEDSAFVWYASLAREGFAPAERLMKPFDEEQGPHLLFADGTETIFLSDMSGDGLTDIVRIRNGEVCYWPNLGYGRFGAKVTMDHAPWFDTPDLFEPRRIRLADIDGNGVTDIIYLGRAAARIYFNQSGNGWSDAAPLPQLPPVDKLTDVRVVDLLGRGTACLVWSSPLPGNARSPMRYIDLMAGQKPHLLVKTVNNLGAETQVSYVSSTRFYLDDKLSGRPWITRLPFPVHVVERVQTFDRISNSRFVTHYAYHHGYFDGVEREFRGFGMVEQWDTEDFTAFSQNDDFMSADNIDPASNVPPAYTRTWFHTGVYRGRNRVSNYFAGLLNDQDVGEYFIPHRAGDAAGDAAAEALLLDDTVLPAGLTLDEEREACRALKGSMLRQEIYALDGSAKQSIPYTVTEQNFTVECLQKQAINRYAVFFTHPREALSYHYERNPDDPRVGHAMTLEVDDYGNVLKSLAIAYGRAPGQSPLQDADDKARQEQLLVTYSENDLTNAIDAVSTWPDDHRTPLPAEARTYEITGLQVPPGATRFSFGDFTGANLQRCANLQEIPYEQTADPTQPQKRLIHCQRNLYRKDDLSTLLAKGQLEPRATAGEAYRLALTPGLLQQVYQRNGTDLLAGNPSALLAGSGGEQGGYVDLDGNQHWWSPAGRMFFSPGSNDSASTELGYATQHFFLPCRYRDPFYANQWTSESSVGYDAYDLLPSQTVDAVGNIISAAHDYRVLQAQIVTDPNGNRVQAAFDALGRVVATAVMGKVAPAPVEGDLLAGFDADPTLANLQQFVADPLGQAASLLGQATTRVVYDVDRFMRCGEPPFSAPLARETHVADLEGGQTKIQLAFSYSDGFGREIQQKIQAEPGDAPQRSPNQTTPGGDIAPGALVLDSGQTVMAPASPRWIGTGRTVFNNKGKPVRQYEPFFSNTPLYESERELTDTGVSPVLFYDPLGRVVATLHPNNTYDKVVFDPWLQTRFDVNDTVAPNGVETGDPRTDPDIAGYVAGYFAAQPPGWQTWYQRRIGGSLGTDEQNAATRTALHANTPALAHADVLGRTFLVIAHNRFKFSDAPPADPPQEEFYPTRVVLDIEGNQRAVRDAVIQAGDNLGRIVMRYDYDMLGNRIHQVSMEAGERWMLHDVARQPLFAWNSRLYTFRTQYDLMRRPLRSTVQGGDPAEADANVYANPILFERTIYGDSSDTGLTQPQQQQANFRGRVFQHFDNAGVATTGGYDFKGNPKSSTREVAQDYQSVIDWSQPQPSGESFASSTTYDALNRPVTLSAPDNSIYRPTYNEANLLDQVDVNLQGAANATSFVANIDYNAKGQRTLVQYGNGANTSYTYEPDTFRLSRLLTQSGGTSLQDLGYIYDPLGNITHIQDNAQQTVFFRNQRVEPSNDYTCDAVYRLIEATGREHLGQAGGSPIPSSYNDAPRIGLPQPGDGNAMGRYLEQYQYDPAGNFLHFIHHGADPVSSGWTRDYAYREPSLLEPAKFNNRLTRTTVGATTETYSTSGDGYDAHGSMLRMPQLQAMRWNFKDQLRLSQRQAVNADDADGNAHQGERTLYVYDATGQRARKVTERSNGTRMKERIYLGGLEIYREYDGQGTSVTLERQTLHVMDDKQRLALVETKTLDTSNDSSPAQLIRYQFSNHLGSASLELDTQANVISYEEYTPYGSTSYQAVDSTIKAAAKRYRYTGMERDEESGLNHHGVRYYVSWIGRWSSCEPGGINHGLNVYGYSHNNPAVLLDINGRDSEYWSGANDIKWDHDHWTYMDETGDIWNYVVQYGEKQTTEWENQWEVGETRFDKKSHTLYEVEHQVAHLVTRTQLGIVFEGWVKTTSEVIQVTGTAPSEEKGWLSRLGDWGLTALSWGFGPKKLVMAYNAYQFVKDVRENGTLQAVENYAIGKVQNKAVDTALSLGKKLVKGASKSSSPHHDKGGKPTGKLRTYVTHKLNDAEKTKLRAEARDIAAAAMGKRLPYGSDVHHRIPLEFAHLQPHLDPNRLDNLIVVIDRESRVNASTGLGQGFHLYLHELWQKQLKGIKNPTAAEIENIASQIDNYIASDRSAKNWSVERLK